MPKENDYQIRRTLLKERQPFKLEDVATELKVGVEVVQSVVEKLASQGYTFRNTGEYYIHSKNALLGSIYDASKRFNGRYLKFGIVSDTHLGSNMERLDLLEQVYDIFKKEGAKTVFHAGDFTDGYGVYRGQEFEVHKVGQEEQIDYAIKVYPQRPLVRTFTIAGNHDLRQYERGGSDPLVQVARARKDIEYLGQLDARVKLADNVAMEILHPSGSIAYALSYKAQRDINNRPASDLPNILVYGHWHTSFYMQYRDVQFLQAPCLKETGLWERSKGLHTTLGCWLVEAVLTDDLSSLAKFKPELFRFQ